MKRDTVTCCVCRTAIARRKTYVTFLDKVRCSDLDACRDRRMIRDEERRSESALEETNRWAKNFSPRKP